MKATIQDLQDSFQIGYDAYEESRIEAAEVWNQYHNRQYTDAQKSVLFNRGQPAETFNVIKIFARMLIGYYSTVVNTVTAKPVHQRDIYTASVLNEIINYTFRTNNFVALGDKIKLSGIISGIMVSYIDVKDTGKRDEFGRPVNEILVEHVPDTEVVLDPLSRLEDYSDARYIHRFKWMSEEAIVELFGKTKLEQLQEYFNHLNIEEAEFTYAYNGEFTGRYRIFNNYLIVHSVVVDDDGKTWSVFWSDEVEVMKTEITHKEVKFPYRVQKIHSSDRTEFYGVFREVVETQKAINQAIIKIQLMANTQKAIVETTAVDNIADFTSAFNRVNGVIEVKDLKGVKIENLAREVLDQYTIIDKAFDRVQRILNINDSFLGVAFASDSGRKVKLQQNATITALRYLTVRIEEFYRLLGWDVANLIKQYYTAHQALRITDTMTGDRWVEINKPLKLASGEIDPQTGQPSMQLVFEEVLDPASGKPVLDDEGNILVAPIPEADTEIAFTDVEVEIESVSFNDENEKNQLMLETMLSGQIGTLLSQINPAGFFKAASLSIKTMQTKNSPDISMILEQTAQLLQGDPEAETEASTIAQGNGSQLNQTPKSASLKLPQNTNEAP